MAAARDPKSIAVPITPSMLMSMAVMEIGKEAKSNHREDILITSIILFVTTPHQDPRQLYVIYVIDG